MSASNKNSKSIFDASNKPAASVQDEEVLFQKIFDKWYAFTFIDGDCLMTEVPQEKVEHFRSKS